MGPFADPLPGQPPLAFALPFAASIAVWYAVCVAALVATAHVWASALERHAGLTIAGGRTGWWLLRGAPILMLAPYVGNALARGQPTTLLVLLVAAFLSLYADRRPVAAAAALGLAIAIKLFPAALLFIPLLRRDFRMLIYVGIWSCVFLFVLPALVLGVEPVLGLYRTLWIDRLSGLVAGASTARVEVELSPWTDDEVSFGAMLARTFAEPAADMPYRIPVWAMGAQWLFDLALLVLWRRSAEADSGDCRASNRTIAMRC